MKIEIKTIGGSLLFEGDFSSIAEAVTSAIKKGVSLRSANLRYANLRSANLSYADLSSANLRYANLRSANLSSADLSSADLRSANLRYANLSYADLSYADLRSADLSSADLSSADLSSAKNSSIAVAMTRILPEGEIIGWKKLSGGLIAKLLIPASAKRSHAFGRKCRAEFVKCLEVLSAGKPAKEGLSHYDGGATVYKAGKMIKPDGWCEDFTQECAQGIHFFITREEAEEYSL